MPAWDRMPPHSVQTLTRVATPRHLACIMAMLSHWDCIQPPPPPRATGLAYPVFTYGHDGTSWTMPYPFFLLWDLLPPPGHTATTWASPTAHYAHTACTLARTPALSTGALYRLPLHTTIPSSGTMGRITPSTYLALPFHTLQHHQDQLCTSPHARCYTLPPPMLFVDITPHYHHARLACAFRLWMGGRTTHCRLDGST